MNNFVQYYMDARKIDSKPENRQLIFAAVARSIAELGTIEDLKSLVSYYESEWGKSSNETNKIA
ncbi:hypothetical protein M3638_01205 [Oceanobacillus profundus]|uniref:hypothetical protein n=1 Tax=Oceanobacillus profundus TaxID=372463 RepID=UPI0020419440|nr:hypothetical protein [Oceanobacillus profundus]MCM3396452.1 hypothetical protein [Oceanobacillus profundus]